MPLLEQKNARMTSAELRAILPDAEAKNFADTPFFVEGFSTDTRTITKGSCFIALKGENFNGNAYAKQAAEKGAVMCILSENPPEDPGVPYLLTDDTVVAYGAIASAYLASRKFAGTKIIGVTGSSGKTTVKDMTAHVLAAKMKTYCTQGNFNNHIGVPFTVLHMPEETEAAVIEMGMNHAGEISRLTKIAQPDLAIVTNIGTAHIGNLGSQENIFRAKMEITEGMNLRTGRLILPGDDPYLADCRKLPFIPANVRYVSRLQMADAQLQAVDIIENPDNTQFSVCYKNESAQVSLPMTGLHNVTDALLAIAAGLECGMSLQDCAAALADFTSGAMRSQRVQFGNCTVICDYYNANPEAMLAALQALETAAGDAPKLAVLGNMNELGDFAAARHCELGEQCKKYADAAFFYGESAADFAAGYGDSSAAFTDQTALIAALCKALPAFSEKPFYMLIKGSRGVHMEHVFEGVQAALNDKK